MAEETEKKPVAVEQKPDFAIKINNQGVALEKEGDYTLAEYFFRVAYAYHSQDPAIAGNLISILVSQNKLDEAAKFGAENYERFKTSSRFLWDYRLIFRQKKQYAEELKILMALEEIRQPDYPQEADFHATYGYVLYQCKRYNDAEARYKKARDIEEQGWHYTSITECAKKAGTLAANEDHMIRHLQANQTSALSPAVRHYLLAEFYKKWAETLENLQPAKAHYKYQRAQECAARAVDEASLESEGDKGKENLDKANRIFAEIEERVRYHAGDGFPDQTP